MSIRILVLEDDADMRELLVEVLAERGFEVVPAAGSAQAMELSRTRSFDLIIADIRMEGRSGLDTIELAKEHQPGLGSIVISGYASEEETLRAVRLNVGGYLKKPFKMNDLLGQINRFVAERTRAKKRREEVESLQKALLWSVANLGRLGEKLHQGKVLRSADLACGVATHLPDLAQSQDELRAATVLEQLKALEELSYPPELRRWLASLPTLARSLDEPDANSHVAAFAARLCREFEEGVGPESLWPDLDPSLLEAYRRWLERGDQVRPDPPALNGLSLLRLGRTLEQTGQLEQACQAYRELLADATLASGRDGVSAWLGLARLSLSQRSREQLEQAVKEALTLAERLGPVSLGASQLAAAELLCRAQHPARAKLLRRAITSLRAVGMSGDAARAVLKLARVSSGEDKDEVLWALKTLADPAYLPEVIENLPGLMEDLFELCQDPSAAQAQNLLRRLVRDYPQQVSSLLRQRRLEGAGRRLLMDLLEQQGGEVAGEVLQVLGADSDPDIRSRALKLKGGADAPPVLKIYSLGVEEVFLGSREIRESDWKSAKVKYLFYYVAAQRNASALVEPLAEEFWPGSPEAARNNMNASVSAIRKTLRGPDSKTGWDPMPREHDRLSLDQTMVCWYDLLELQTAYRAGLTAESRGEPEQAMVSFRRVVQLHRGPFLEGCYQEWALARRQECEGALRTSLERLVHHCLSGESFQEALEYAARWLALHPESQEAHHAKMRAHLGLGQTEAVVKQYESCARMLESEYGVEPGTELLRTFHQARYGLGDSTSSFLG